MTWAEQAEGRWISLPDMFRGRFESRGLGCYLALYVAGLITFGRATPVRPLSLDPLIWGFAASLGFGLLFSLATPPPPRAVLH